ncbi:hypothetical protein [Halorientalis marina]|uniref:hypothetical protein n=1 Tax=Halorientalis marina TaxID=2931976 RepID=UPI001FF13C12|nr:hypothetical protein [Halorientalis marina]
MFGFGRSTYDDVADVIVTDAADLRLVDPGDVFVERSAVGGEITVSDAGDLRVRGPAASLPDPARDCVVDDGDDAAVRDCEDVLVRANAVDGTLEIEDSRHDVVTKQTDRVVAEGVEDVRIEGGVDDRADLRVRSAQDVRFSQGAVATDVTAVDVEDVLQAADGAVADGVEASSVDRRAPVHVDAAEDLLVADDAIEGAVTVADPEDVVVED